MRAWTWVTVELARMRLRRGIALLADRYGHERVMVIDPDIIDERKPRTCLAVLMSGKDEKKTLAELGLSHRAQVEHGFCADEDFDAEMLTEICAEQVVAYQAEHVSRAA